MLTEPCGAGDRRFRVADLGDDDVAVDVLIEGRARDVPLDLAGGFAAYRYGSVCAFWKYNTIKAESRQKHLHNHVV